MTLQGDPHLTLGVAPGASLNEIRSAYRRLAKQYHPDSAGERAVPRFLAIQAAYERLVDGDGRLRPSERRAALASGGRPKRGDAGRADAGRARAIARCLGGGAGSPGCDGASAWRAAIRAERRRIRRGRTRQTARGWKRARTRTASARTPGARRERRPRDRPRTTRRPRRRWTRAWDGGAWYGPTSGTYWTINPREYADPRKHGPEYLARARRAAAQGAERPGRRQWLPRPPDRCRPAAAAPPRPPGAGRRGRRRRLGRRRPRGPVDWVPSCSAARDSDRHLRRRPGVPARLRVMRVRRPRGDVRPDRPPGRRVRAGGERDVPPPRRRRAAGAGDRPRTRPHGRGSCGRGCDLPAPRPARVAADVRRRAVLGRERRGGGPAPGRALAAGRGQARRAARPPRHVPARQPDRPGRAAPPPAGVPAVGASSRARGRRCCGSPRRPRRTPASCPTWRLGPSRPARTSRSLPGPSRWTRSRWTGRIGRATLGLRPAALIRVLPGEADPRCSTGSRRRAPGPRGRGRVRALVVRAGLCWKIVPSAPGSSGGPERRAGAGAARTHTIRPCPPTSASASRPARPGPSTSGPRARRCSTTCSPATPAARSSSASRTPTSPAARSRTRRTSSTACTGWGSPGTRGRESPGSRRPGPYAPVPPDGAAADVRRGRRAAARGGPGLPLLLHARGARRRPQGPGGREAAAALRRSLRDADPGRAGASARPRAAAARSASASGPGVVGWDDLVRGRVEIDTANLGGDFVIVRADGTPLYHFTVVVDDMAMRISHVIRGEDHVSNTPKHILLFGALGYPLPVFAPPAAHPQSRRDEDEQAQEPDGGGRLRRPGLPARGPRQLLRVPRLVARAPRRTSSPSTRSSSASSWTRSRRAVPASTGSASSGSTASGSAASPTTTWSSA